VGEWNWRVRDGKGVSGKREMGVVGRSVVGGLVGE
jgi:hypothetical protein